MRRLDLLQNAALFITKCAHYYKMRNVLQNASLLQNATEHAFSRVLILFLLDKISPAFPQRYRNELSHT